MDRMNKGCWGSMLKLVLLVCLTISSAAEAATLGYWRFEGNYLDSSGNGWTLTPAGSPSFSPDRASTAPGSQSVNIPSGSRLSSRLFPPLNDFTAELFFKTSQTTGIHYLLTAFDHTACCDVSPNPDDNTGGWLIYLDDGKVTFRLAHRPPHEYELRPRLCQ